MRSGDGDDGRMESSTISSVGGAIGREIFNATGNYVTDTTGKRYLDLSMGMGSCFLGHNPPEVTKAVIEHGGDFVVGQFFNSARKRLLHVLADFLPPELDHVLLFNTGTEAVEAALLVARRITGRTGIVRFRGCFHGKSYLTASLDTTGFREAMGLSPWGDYVLPSPTQVDGGSSVANESVSLDQALGELDRLLRREKRHLGALIIEPIQGSAGNREVPLEFLRQLREISTSEGLVLIADEVASGFGRSGEPFAFSAAGIMPDVVTGGKAISSGLPIGLTLLSTSLVSEAGLVQAGATSTTFGANSLSCLVASVTAETILNQCLWEKARIIGLHLREKLESLASDVSEASVSGRGLMLGLELGPRFRSPARSSELSQLLLDKGVICPIDGSRIRLFPSVLLSQEETDQFAATLREAVGTSA